MSVDHSLDLPYGALIGPSPKDPETMLVCAWCPTNKEATAWAKARGYRVSHGLCAKCSGEQMAQLEECLADEDRRPVPTD